MTGYAIKIIEQNDINLEIELRSVNSRFLDLHFRLSDELRPFEPAIREKITAQVSRGKIECRVLLRNNSNTCATHITLNHMLLARLKEAQTLIQQAFPQALPLSSHEILRWPGLLEETSPDTALLQTQLMDAMDTALADFTTFRCHEGKKLAQAVAERTTKIRALVTRLIPRIPEIARNYEKRLTLRLQEAVGQPDYERLRQEVTLFMQRIDVDEELTRLTAHLDAVEQALTVRQPVGKRLDFLMQELNRETNTLASKSVAQDVTDTALEMKIYIEQMREQVQNME